MVSQIPELADRASGPFYVYSLSAIKSRMALLRSLIPGDVQIFYSFKANSHPQIIETLFKTGALADIASKGELEVALSSGYLGPAIEFTGPGKTYDELTFAVQSNVGSIIAESIQEIEDLEQICSSLEKKISVHVRLNPLSKLNSTGRALENEPSQFGIDEEDLSSLIATLKRCSHVEVIGTHSHTQSQFLSVENSISNLRYALDAAGRFSKTTGIALQFVNMGGGLGIPYSTQQSPIDLAQFGAALKKLIEAAQSSPVFAKAKFRMEFGRLLVGEAGIFVTRVLYTKVSRGKKFVITDGGFTQSQIACGVGQLVRRNLPIQVISDPENVSREKVTVAGPSCYGLDILAEDVELPELKTGDLICIQNVGAYGYSFSPVGFLRQQPANEYFL